MNEAQAAGQAAARKTNGTRAAKVGSPWYTVGDMARLFDVTERTVWMWTAAGKLPEPVRRGDRWTRWRREEIDALIADM